MRLKCVRVRYVKVAMLCNSALAIKRVGRKTNRLNIQDIDNLKHFVLIIIADFETVVKITYRVSVNPNIEC